MSKHLTVNETVGLLDNLKRTVREFAASEERITREHRAKQEAIEKRLKDEIEAHEAEFADKIAQTDAQFQAAKEQVQARYEQRKSRITKAQHSSHRYGLQRVESEEGRKKYPIQKGLLDTKRNREEALKQNEAHLADFHAQLGQNRAAFVDLEECARKALRGYWKFRRMLRPAGAGKLPDPTVPAEEQQVVDELGRLHHQVESDIAKFRKFPLPKLFSYLPLSLWALLIAIAAGVLPYVSSFSTSAAAVLGAVVFVLIGVVHFQSKIKATPLATSICKSLEIARRLQDSALEKAQIRHATEIQRIEAEAKAENERLEHLWHRTHEETATAKVSWPQALEQKSRRVSQKHEELFRSRRLRLEHDHSAATERLRSEAELRKRHFVDSRENKITKLESEYAAQWETLAAEWKLRSQAISDALAAANQTAEEQFPDWPSPAWRNWQPPAAFSNAAKFARLDVDLKRFCDALPQDQRLVFPGAAAFSVPMVLKYPQQGSVLFETTKLDSDAIIASINNIIFRLLAQSPPGKVSFTIIDPVKLGQNFATVMHLADYEDNVINGRIWTQAMQIEERLADLNEHMEKVIQMYLRNEYETIADYNAEAGNIAEKYHFVVIADFPANFTQTSVRRLQRIAASGARCGVYTLIHWDQRLTPPPDFLPDELRKASACITGNGAQLELTHPAAARAGVTLDIPPEPDFATEFLHKIGQLSRGSNRVEVPFEQVAPSPAEIWSLDTTDELRVPIGRSGATKLQYLAIGKGTRQHTLIAGKTGSGKSTLFHVMITNLALWCSPEQVEFYLVDFKKGVEFKGYAVRRLPHARVVAIESDREFGLSVLQRVDDELKRRGDLFRRLGVQDLAGYKKSRGTEPMPRCLLLIDEFQEFFVEDDRISQAANVLLDRIVRQGRAFGIHVLLGSQTLGGAYTLARTTIGQMVIRVALQCNEADAYLIMDENNAAPRLLSRPGEGIYNDMAGASEGNSPFQAVWLSDEERDARLREVTEIARSKRRAYSGPIVFEGNAPADVRENDVLRKFLEAPAVEPPRLARMWLGTPNSIKGPTEAVFSRRSGNNLIVVGQRDEAMLAILSTGLVSLAAQYPVGATRFIYCESSAPASPERAFLAQVIDAIPHEVKLVTVGDLVRTMTALNEELQKRTDNESASAPETFVFIHGLQNFKKLRQDEDFGFSMDDAEKSANVAAQFQKLVNEGPSHGIHIIASIDTYNNVNRFLGRKGLTEFEMRVLFQMSANDSASLCDDPKASALGLHRALFYNEQEGYLETFRPYALPDSDWLEDASRNLARLKES